MTMMIPRWSLVCERYSISEVCKTQSKFYEQLPQDNQETANITKSNSMTEIVAEREFEGMTAMCMKVASNSSFIALFELKRCHSEQQDAAATKRGYFKVTLR